MEIKKKLEQKMEEFNTIFEKYNKYFAENSKYTFAERNLVRTELSKCVKEIEQLRLDYDELIGFNTAQKKIHDLVFSVNTKKEGFMDISSYNKKLSNFEKLVYTMYPSIKLNLVAITTGSTGVIMDFEKNNPDDPEESQKENLLIEQHKESISEFIGSVLKMAQNDTEKALTDTNEKITKLQSKYKYPDKKFKNILKASVAIIKDDQAEGETIKTLSVNTETIDKGLFIDIKEKVKERKRLSRVNSEINKFFKEEEPLVVSGQMRQIEEWEKEEKAGHKFVLVGEENNEEKQYTINYTPQKEIVSIIKQKVGTYVSVKRYKKGSSWWLENWV